MLVLLRLCGVMRIEGTNELGVGLRHKIYVPWASVLVVFGLCTKESVRMLSIYPGSMDPAYVRECCLDNCRCDSGTDTDRRYRHLSGTTVSVVAQGADDCVASGRGQFLASFQKPMS